MSAVVLILRPEPAGRRTAQHIISLGFAPILYPLFALEAVGWAPPADSFDALLLTSANAVLFGGAALTHYQDLPVFAVGPATARAAIDAGFRDVHPGGGNVAATVPMIASAGHAHVLHPCGDMVRPYDPCGLDVRRAVVYRTVPAGNAAGLAALLPAEGELAALVHSPRAGERLAALISPVDRRRIAIAAISPAAAKACRQGWRSMAVAVVPDEDALLECLQMLV
jgi:uroporphyrinogen-III synthase